MTSPSSSSLSSTIIRSTSAYTQSVSGSHSLSPSLSSFLSSTSISPSSLSSSSPSPSPYSFSSFPFSSSSTSSFSPPSFSHSFSSTSRVHSSSPSKSPHWSSSSSPSSSSSFPPLPPPSLRTPVILRPNRIAALRTKYGDRLGDDFDFPPNEREMLVSSLPTSSASLEEILRRKKGKPLPKIDSAGRSFAVGGRKTSRASVWIRPGSGEIWVNNMKHSIYFHRFEWTQQFLVPFEVTGTIGKFDVIALTKGGGKSGQCGAIRLGISRALGAWNPKYRDYLSDFGLLTRDPRQVERKKFGKYKARRGYTYKRR